MAVAKTQIEELVTTIRRFVPREWYVPMLLSFRQTQAYRRNSSFRQTIERLIDRGADDAARETDS